MAIIPIEHDVWVELFKLYARLGHPLGKSRKGRKKWLKKFVLKTLVDHAIKSWRLRIYRGWIMIEEKKLKNRTIFRNEEENIYLAPRITRRAIDRLLEKATLHRVLLFSSKTPAFESVYYNKDEDKIGGCDKDITHMPDRRQVSYREFLQEIIKPKKRTNTEPASEELV